MERDAEANAVDIAVLLHPTNRGSPGGGDETTSKVLPTATIIVGEGKSVL